MPVRILRIILCPLIHVHESAEIRLTLFSSVSGKIFHRLLVALSVEAGSSAELLE
jgi:hypothetical protein